MEVYTTPLYALNRDKKEKSFTLPPYRKGVDFHVSACPVGPYAPWPQLPQVR